MEPESSTTLQLAGDLADYYRQYEEIKRDAADLTAGLSNSQFNWRSHPGRWSIGDCIAHLNLVGVMYLPDIDRAIATARAKGWHSDGPFRYGPLGRMIVRSMEPPPKKRLGAPETLLPDANYEVAGEMADFNRLQNALMKRIVESQGLDIARAKIRSQIMRLVNLGMGQWFLFIAAHERRHLWQARQVLNDPRFPRG